MTMITPAPFSITSTNVPLDDYLEWNKDTTYNKGNKCTIAEEKKNYWCLENGTNGEEKNPKNNSQSGGLWIAEPMNAYACVNHKNSKPTVNDELIEMHLHMYEADTIVLFGVDATEVHFEYSRNSEVIHTETVPMIEFEMNSFYDYLFPKYQKRTICVSQPNIIMHFGVDVKVSILSPNSKASLGFLFCGQSHWLGTTIVDGEMKIKSFGKSKRDEWGNLKVGKGKVYNTLRIPVSISNKHIENVQRLLLEYSQTLCVFSADNEGYSDMTTLFGKAEDLEVPLTNQTTDYTLRLEAAYGTDTKN